MNSQRGINLLELMIVIAIIGIVASIAYPSYVDNVQDTRRADCSAALVGLGNAMERFYSVNGTYRRAADGAVDTGAPAVFPTSCPIDGGNATYDLTIETADESTYTLRATPVGPQSDDECGSLTLTNRALKGIVGADVGLTPEDCW